jgi:hypothetical protein
VNVVHAGQPLVLEGPSIFLAGPTPRSPDVLSWRPEAVDLLLRLGFAGTVFVPERPDGWARVDYLDQVEWECAGLESCSVVAFWVPRDVARMPGFTTNVEFGRYVGSDRCVYGRPEGAPHTKYLDWLYAKVTGRTPEHTLEGAMRAAVAAAGRGVSRGQE